MSTLVVFFTDHSCTFYPVSTVNVIDWLLGSLQLYFAVAYHVWDTLQNKVTTVLSISFHLVSGLVFFVFLFLMM